MDPNYKFIYLKKKILTFSSKCAKISIDFNTELKLFRKSFTKQSQIHHIQTVKI